ncbi:hypothetical protein M9458_020843, partial [Cirrhinus mrigala]
CVSLCAEGTYRPCTGALGGSRQAAALCGECTAIALSAWGTSVSPLATLPSWVVKEEELVYHVLAESRAFCDFINFLCAFGEQALEASIKAITQMSAPLIQPLFGCPFKHGHHFSFRLKLRISSPQRLAQLKLQLQMAHALLAMLPLTILL